MSESDRAYKVRVEVTEGEWDETQLERCTRQVFSNPLLLKEILKPLSCKVLLRCSLVDRKWNVMARELLRESGNCLADIEDGPDGSDLMVFNSVLADMTESPFSGLSIHLAKEFHLRQKGFLEKAIPDEDKIDMAQKLLERIDIQYIRISDFGEFFLGGPLAHKTLEVVLKQVAPTLKGLSVEIGKHVGMHEFSFTEFFGITTLTGQWLPALTTLELAMNWAGGSDIFETGRNVIHELLFAARNLQHLQLLHDGSSFWDEDRVGLILDLPHKPLHLVNEFEFRSNRYYLDAADTVATFRPQLRKLRFSIGSMNHWMPSQFENWPLEDRAMVRQTLEALLLSSQDSLEKFAVEHHDEFVLIMSQWNLPVLNQVKFLELTYNERIDADGGIPTLEKIDLSRVFPSLTTVSISDTMHRREREEYEDEDEDVEPQPYFYVSEYFRSQLEVYPCASVTTLRCKFDRDSGLQLQKLEMCRRMFPNVKHLIVEMPHVEWFSTHLWTLWPELESLTILDLKLDFSNFDAFFLGLQPEEVKMLVTETQFQGQEEDLEIVPTSPSLLNLKNLQSLRLQVCHVEPWFCNQSEMNGLPPPVCQDGYSKGHFLFSPLMWYCAFCRLPGLEVEVSRDLCDEWGDCYLELEHLRQYVNCYSFIDRRADSYWE